MTKARTKAARTPKARRSSKVFLMVGSRKGAFIFETDSSRRRWNLRGPFHKGIEVNHLITDTRSRNSIFAAMTSAWFGTRLDRSDNLGRTWKESTEGLRFAPEANMTVARIWHIRPGHPSQPKVLYAGVDPGALFKSGDGGKSWASVDVLHQHESRGKWSPGAGGMMVHSIQVDPGDPNRVFVGISAAGTFRTDDGGRTWAPFNQGVRADFLPDKLPEAGQCVHKLLVASRGKGVLFQQNHCGVYRTHDGGES